MSLLSHVRSFEGVLLDVWGVLHDGRRPYADAAEALDGLREKRTLLVSNAPWRGDRVLASVRDLGLPTDGLLGALTAGDVAHEQLTRLSANGVRRAWMVGTDRHRPLLHGLPLELVDHPRHADLVLLAHPAPMPEGSLEVALTAGLPMLCANPDLRVVHQDGETTWCAGRLAQQYAEAGGTVHYAGKPEQEIYTLALRRLGLQPPDVVAVGDTPETDLLGASRAGIAAIWVTRRGETTADPRLEGLPTAPLALLPTLS